MSTNKNREKISFVNRQLKLCIMADCHFNSPLIRLKKHFFSKFVYFTPNFYTRLIRIFQQDTKVYAVFDTRLYLKRNFTCQLFTQVYKQAKITQVIIQFTFLWKFTSKMARKYPENICALRPIFGVNPSEYTAWLRVQSRRLYRTLFRHKDNHM